MFNLISLFSPVRASASSHRAWGATLKSFLTFALYGPDSAVDTFERNHS